MDQLFTVVLSWVAISLVVFGVILRLISLAFFNDAKSDSKKENALGSQANLIAGSIIGAFAYIVGTAGMVMIAMNFLLSAVYPVAR